MESAGGKLPDNYEGAFEKFLKEKRAALAAKKGSINSITGDSDVKSDYTQSDFSDTEELIHEPQPQQGSKVEGCTAITHG